MINNMRTLVLFFVISCFLVSCRYSNGKPLPPCESCFFGDSVAVIKLTNRPNGYKISILHQRDGLDLMHFQRGDSINQYISINSFPRELQRYYYGKGVYYTRFDIPVMKVECLSEGSDFMFMDINFDGQEDFLVRVLGYNRTYYQCYDLVNGSQRGRFPMMLECLSEPPYNNLGAGGACETIFDFANESLIVEEELGCCCHIRTFARKLRDDEYSFDGNVVVFREEEREVSSEGALITIKERIDDTLKVVKQYMDLYE